ncbi:tetratricopeptide repeat protein [Thioalkalivibrio paradoxus]|uniref:Uncharacterized protein n=1 Tax=Thioalkalivibrio paradoxus ARh 1 TaxID=713585 RepID=W0DRK9_9GAMM|nr:tetratricopeptide repeat protein [Thioalkalivibrio paradoxus]AHE99897.1 hypothetical protein THITH_03175 [Thioalkalivibrio paradoxus ARh 1]
MTGPRDHIEEGVRHHLAGELEAAASAYRAALELEADNATAHNNLGFIYGQQQRWEEALRHLGRAVELAPGMAMAHSNLGQVLVARGAAEQGLTHLDRATRLAPGEVQVWDNLARNRLHLGDAAGAVEAWQEAVRLVPGDPRLLSRLGTAMAACGLLDQAIDRFRSLLEVEPRHVDAWVQLGITLFLRKDLGSARDALLQALALAPSDLSALRHLGLVQLACGEQRDALQTFDALYRLDARQFDNRLDLAVLLLSQGQAPDALAHLRELSEALAGNERVGFYLALALRETGAEEEARERLDALVAAGGEYARRAAELLGEGDKTSEK